MGTKWTASQLEAINHYKNDTERGVIVSAGAGSGKTAVLTEMILTRIKEQKDFDISRCAVVTFTEKAAGELKTRLAAGIKRCIEENEDNPEIVRRLKLSRRSLGQARISTISSFCLGIIRDNIERSELTNGFTVIDAQRSQFMKLNAVNEALDEFCADSEKAKRIKFLLRQTESRGYEDITDYVLRLGEFLCSVCDREEWIKNAREMTYEASVLEARKKEVENWCDNAKNAFTSFKTEAGGCDEKMSAYISGMENSSLAAINQIIGNNYCFDSTADSLLAGIPAKSTAPIRKNEPLKNARDSFISAYENAVRTARAYTAVSDEKTRERAREIINDLLELTLCYEEKYSKLKISRNNADFADAEYMVYNMLKKDSEAIKSKMNLQLIVVDEFQDSNRMQYEIFRMLSDDCKNLYFVGDIKQSIYSFRKAQPEVFASVCEDTEHYREIRLSENFRSRRNVIDGINYIFDRIMTKELGGVDYAAESRLIAGRQDKAEPCDITEILLVENSGNDSTTSEVQAKAVASKIRSMVGNYMIPCKEGKRPCTPDDFAIIIRSPRGVAENYIKALKEEELCVEVRDGKLTEQPEIRIMLDYLSAIDNPYNDDSLARLMMSGLYGFTARQMSDIRLGLCDIDTDKLKSEIGKDRVIQYSSGYKKRSLYGCVFAAANDYRSSDDKEPDKNGDIYSATKAEAPTRKKCAGLLADLGKFSGLKASLSPAELIRLIYDSAPTKNLLIISEDPQSRSENLSALADCAREYSDINGGGTIGDFLRNLKILDEQNHAPSAAPSTSGGVKLMSIHASKGLQFPIVFVAECNSSFNTSDSRKSIIFSDNYGIACNTVDRGKFSERPSACMKDMQEMMNAKTCSEEMRLLYVAATRAQEKLFLVAAQKKPKPSEREVYNGILNKFLTSAKPKDIEGSSYFMWLRAVLCLDVPVISGNKEDADGAEAATADTATTEAATTDTATTDTATTDTATTEAVATEAATAEIDEIMLKNAVVYRELTAIPGRSAAVSEADNITADKDSVRAITDMINFVYPHKADTKIAAKYSATEIVRNRKLASGGKDISFISRPSFVQETGKLKGKRLGDAYHKLMEHIPIYKLMTEREISDYLVNEAPRFLSDIEIKSVSAAVVAEFMKTEIARRIAAVGEDNLYREHAVFHRIKASELSPLDLGLDEDTPLCDSETYIQGIVDMFFREGDHIVLVDYKSDNFSSREEPIRHYSVQLELYKKAIEAEFGLPVTEMYIYAFSYGEFIPIPIN